MEKVKVKIDGKDFSQSIDNVRMIQELGNHHFYEIRILLTDIVDKFKGILQQNAKELIGKPVDISIEGNGFKGIVTGVSLSRIRRSENVLVIYGGSPTILMDEGPNTVSFYEQTMKQIADTLLNQYKSKFSAVTVSPGSKEKLKYIVQYNESNFQFLSRMAASYGDWFFYDGEQIFYTTKPALKSNKVIKLYQDKNLLEFDLSVKTLPVNFKLTGYDYKKHEYLSGESAYSGKVSSYTEIALDKSKKEVFVNSMQLPVSQSHSDKDIQQMKGLTEQSRLTKMVVLVGSSTEPSLKVGNYIQILDERMDLKGSTEDYGNFLIASLSHSFGKNGDQYSNSFEAVPAEVEIPPYKIALQHPFCEMQLAEVMENNDPDQMGRIRVQFVWQRGTDQLSPWIRVASSSSGKDKGFYSIPEKGDQVVVAFEHNDPERPYSLSCLYNGQSKPQHFNSSNHLKAISTKGGHSILMNDEGGKESFAVTSPKDFSVTASSGKITITGQEVITVESKAGAIMIKSPGKVTIQADIIEFKANSKISLKAPKIKCSASEKFSVVSPTVNIEGNETNTIKGNEVNLEGATAANITGGVIKLN